MGEKYLIDASGSMLNFRDVVAEILGNLGEDDVVFRTTFREDSPIAVHSDSGEAVDSEMELHGPTPLADALEAVAEVTNDRVIVVTDGILNRPSRFEEIREEIPNAVEIRLLDDNVPDRFREMLGVEE